MSIIIREEVEELFNRYSKGIKRFDVVRVVVYALIFITILVGMSLSNVSCKVITLLSAVVISAILQFYSKEYVRVETCLLAGSFLQYRKEQQKEILGMSPSVLDMLEVWSRLQSNSIEDILIVWTGVDIASIELLIKDVNSSCIMHTFYKCNYKRVKGLVSPQLELNQSGILLYVGENF